VVWVGVGLRVAQWLGNPSLWLDELQLVRNILDRRMVELLVRGLDLGQTAPVGYLLTTKTVTLIFGDGELALRAVPVGAAILALILFWRLAQGLLSPPGALVATAGFALNPLLISFGSTVKQYSTDVLATVLILLALRFLLQGNGSLRARMLVGVGAGAVGFLSIPSVVVAGAAIVALLYEYLRSGRLGRLNTGISTVAPLVVWAAVSLAGALWARALMLPRVAARSAYWTGAGGFAPPFTDYPTWVLDRWSMTVLPEFLLRPYIGAPGQLGSSLAPLLSSSLGWTILLGGLIVAAVALIRLRGLGWAMAILVPFPLALGLARLGVYPMDGRTSAFLLPLVLLLLGGLASWIALLCSRSIPRLKVVVPVMFTALFTMVLIDRPPIYVVKQDRAVIRELSQRARPGEPIFAHAWSRSALRYYGPRFGLTNAVVFGSDAATLRGDLALIDAFRGEPSVWILFTHSSNRNLVLCYLDEVGREVEREAFPGGMPNNPASLHRYDLSDETRWASPEAARSPLTPDAFEGDSPRCRRQQWR
jgi:4-amino-4-deoxy-L-arabinose transferase-like glycosyltransferase